MEQWEQLTDVERTCLGVAFSRWHASATGSSPCTWPDSTPWYRDPLGAAFVGGIPAAKQQELEERWLKGGSWIRLFCAVRTAEIDSQLQEALKACAGIQQMVLMGAGMDTRAWRLQWPPGFSVFEVDSQPVLDFKQRILLRSSSGSSAGGSNVGTAAVDDGGSSHDEQVGQLPPLSCACRKAVVADASQAEDLWSRLLAAGLSAGTPVVWVLEGFIGYLERERGNALLRLLATKSAPGSRIIMTAPPAPAEREHRGHGLKLHHSTFEQPQETLARLSAAGWSDCVLLTQEQLAAKYGVERAQPILLGAVVVRR